MAGGGVGPLKFQREQGGIKLPEVITFLPLILSPPLIPFLPFLRFVIIPQTAFKLTGFLRNERRGGGTRTLVPFCPHSQGLKWDPSQTLELLRGGRPHGQFAQLMRGAGLPSPHPLPAR